MKNRTIVYNITNLLFILCAVLMLIYNKVFNLNLSFKFIIIAVCLIIVIHSLKFVKIYLLLMEEHIPIKRFLKIYIKTTFVSIVLPFKLGEIFKIYSYGYETNNAQKGIISVLVDKFYDALILCIIFVMCAIFKIHNINILGIGLISFSILCIICYLIFPSTYHYLNKFFINAKQSKVNNKILYVLDEINEIYKNLNKMLKERQLLLFIITAIYWAVEIIFIYIIGFANNIHINNLDVYEYINDAFIGKTNLLFNNYVCICSVLFFFLILIIYISKAYKEVKNAKN